MSFFLASIFFLCISWRRSHSWNDITQIDVKKDSERRKKNQIHVVFIWVISYILYSLKEIISSKIYWNCIKGDGRFLKCASWRHELHLSPLLSVWCVKVECFGWIIWCCSFRFFFWNILTLIHQKKTCFRVTGKITSFISR